MYRPRLLCLLALLGLTATSARALDFVVSNNNDSGTGSLRAAIQAANGNAGADSISFNIGGNCPRVLSIATPLPTITDDLTINGYSQPGASANTLAIGSDAAICVVILAQSGSVNHALAADGAGTSLTVRGLAFGSSILSGSLGRAIQLLGGSGHVIEGNAFGGFGPGVLGDIGVVNIGVAVFSDTGSVAIGGSNPAQRNIFGGVHSGIYTSAPSSVFSVRNNYFGLSASGNSGQDLVDADGIDLNTGGNNSLIHDNVFASLGVGVRLGQVSGVKVYDNRFGLSATGAFGAQFANGNAIILYNGAHDNVIGDADGLSASNVITNSLLAGVYLEDDAGIGNVIRPNTVYGNSFAEGELGVDIAPPGQNPNDSLDADDGPNGGQNWPVLVNSVYLSPSFRTISGYLSSVPGRSYKIDFYRAVSCQPNGRAEAVTRIGTQTITTANGGLFNGTAFFEFDLSSQGAPGFITAMATDQTTQSSSEFSPCLLEVFLRDGFE